jgi:hypothetical protein
MKHGYALKTLAKFDFRQFGQHGQHLQKNQLFPNLDSYDCR